MALAIWTEGRVNPRYANEHWRLIQNYGLLAEGADRKLELTERGVDFTDHEFGKAETFLDEQEGLIKLLTLVADAGSASASRSALREPWKEYLTRYSGYQARTTVDSTLSSRLNHLVHRDLVKRDGSDYEITKAGLDHLRRADAAGGGVEAKWDSYLATAKERQEEIDRQEDYKATLAEEVTKARAALLSDNDDWPQLVVDAIKHNDNNIIFHVNKSKLTNWIEGNRTEAREALLGMWSQGDRSPGDRVRAFDAKVPASVWPRTAVGTRLNSASYLMMGLDAQRYPPYQRTPFTKAYRRLGYPIPTSKDAADAYVHALGFLDHMLEEALKRGMNRPSTRMDAQSVVWQLRDEPEDTGGDTQPTGGFTRLAESLEEDGLLFSREQVANYILALQAKRFAILTGISGTGKTRIAKAVARHFQPVLQTAVAKIPEDAIEVEVKPYHIKWSKMILPKVMAAEFRPLGPDAPLAHRQIRIRYPQGETSLAYYHDKEGATALSFRGEFKEWFRSGTVQLGDRIWLRVREGEGPDSDELEIGLSETKIVEAPVANYEVVPVRPDWVDNRGLLGYLNPLTSEYSTTPFLDLLLRARAEEERAAATGENAHPFFVILDEMNLARVEHYFSDFLSALESGEDIPLHENAAIESGESESGPQVPRKLKVPGNVLFTGTVNVDETTYMFSPKVLDRAFTIEFDQVDLEGFTTGEANEEASGLDLDGVEDALDLLRSGSSGGDWKPGREDWMEFSKGTPENHAALLELHSILEEQHRHFGYRVANEIARFVNLARQQAEDPGAAADAAFDLALLQKVLPKFHGTQQELESLLKEIFQFAVYGGDHGSKGKQSVKVDDWNVVAGRLTASSADAKPPAYPRTGAKVLRMLQRLQDRGFTSFIE
ncbi:MAG: hypothetical protein OXH49_08450 [Gemmatimonadetes bacterium]|nr:hypothetical protein [Gemmatimonadota bacterium]